VKAIEISEGWGSIESLSSVSLNEAVAETEPWCHLIKHFSLSTNLMTNG